MTKIFLDPGHGGSDPGAVGNGMQEKNLTLSISRQIRDMLVTEYENVEVRMSRTGDTTLSLTERTNMANNWGADYFLSVHINAGGGTGFESFVHTSQSSGSVRAQNIIHPAIMQQIGGTDRGKKNANFAVLRTSKMPAILTEVLFIDNANDAAKLKDPAFLTRAARGHVDGLAQAFNLQRKGGASKPGANKPKPTAPKGDQKTTSLVDYLKSINVDSSFSNRAKLAATNGIKNYEGTAAQNTQLLNILRGGGAAKTTNSKPKPKSGEGIVDYMKRVGMDSSYANRAKLAQQYGIKNYEGTAAQNIELLKKISG
ncbi:DUF3597 family protein [Alkalihalobacillus clausii]|nr:DUF3597 family protein [Shouchella clausii]